LHLSAIRHRGLARLSLHDALPISGETGELTLKNLQGAGVTKVTVANRTFEKAAQLADQNRSGAVAINQLEGVLGEIDIVISSTADRKSTRLNSSHVSISYAVFCLK